MHKIDDTLSTRQYIQLFDQIWHNPDQLDDVTEAVREHIASVYAENSPQRVYFLILYNLFNEFLEDISEDVLPNDRTGYQGTEVDLPPEQRTTDAILAQLDFDFFELLDAATIARSRKHIQAFYDTTDIGAFPERMKPESLRPPLTDLAGAPTFNEIFEQLQLLTLAVYTPLAYVFESRRDKYEQIYGAGAGQNYMGGENANLGAANREQGIRKLMTVNLLKRLESSIEAFRLTLNRLEHTVADAIEAVDNHAANIADIVSAFTDIDADDDDFEFPTSGTVGRKVQIDLADMDVESWSRDLAHDGTVIQNLLHSISGITPEHDSKLHALLERLDAKFRQPLNPGNRKILIFSAFADTAEYLYKNLAPALKQHGYYSALVTGQGNPPRRSARDTASSRSSPCSPRSRSSATW